MAAFSDEEKRILANILPGVAAAGAAVGQAVSDAE